MIITRVMPLSEQPDVDLAGIDLVISTHLHFDHCGGNHLFAGRPIYVQHREPDDERSLDDSTIREWVDAPGVKCVPVDGELDEPRAEGQRLVRALDPELVWLSHEHQPWRSGHGSLS